MNNTKIYNDSEIIEGIKNSDEKIVEYVYKLFYSSAKKLYLQQFSDEQDEDTFSDIIQDSFLNLFTRVKSDGFLINDKVSIIGYLLSIFKNNLYNQLRQKNRASLLNNQDDDEISYTVGNINSIELSPVDPQQNIDNALLRLNEVDRNLIIMFYMNGESIEEIARELGMTVDAVKHKKYRVMSKLREIINSMPKEN